MIWRVCSIAMVVIVLLFGSAGGVWAEEEKKPEGTEIIFDLAIARPLGFASLVLGTSVFIVSLPFVAIVGDTKQTAEALVVEPYRFTFVRDLGKYY